MIIKGRRGRLQKAAILSEVSRITLPRGYILVSACISISGTFVAGEPESQEQLSYGGNPEAHYAQDVSRRYGQVFLKREVRPEGQRTCLDCR